jgi:CheY-like chemotaxis protein
MPSVKLKVLLADDDENDRLLFTDALKELNNNIHIAIVNDGVELMDYLEKEVINFPQLLFLDINMPRKNGFECLKEIRDVYKNEIIIAILSTSSFDKDIEDTFLKGANVYMQKPNNFNALKQALSKIVMATYTYQNIFFNKENFLLKV